MKRNIEEIGYKFWKNLDSILDNQKKTLEELAVNCSISYGNITAMRSRATVPRIDFLLSISDYLSVSMDYLVKGRDNLNLSPEALLVENNLTYRQLIRGCEEIPELLPALTSLLQVGRKEEIEKPS